MKTQIMMKNSLDSQTVEALKLKLSNAHNDFNINNEGEIRRANGIKKQIRSIKAALRQQGIEPALNRPRNVGHEITFKHPITNQQIPLFRVNGYRQHGKSFYRIIQLMPEVANMQEIGREMQYADFQRAVIVVRAWMGEYRDQIRRKLRRPTIDRVLEEGQNMRDWINNDPEFK